MGLEPHEEVVARDVLVEIDPRAFAFTPSLMPGGVRPPGSWIWQCTWSSPSRVSPVDDIEWEREDRPAAAEVRRQRRTIDLSAAIELERDQPRQRERPALDDGRPAPDRVYRRRAPACR